MQLWNQQPREGKELLQAEQVTSRDEAGAIAERCRSRLFADRGGDWWVTLTPNVTGPGGRRGPFGQSAWFATFTDDGAIGVWAPTTSAGG